MATLRILGPLQIARIAHEANRVYCQMTGSKSRQKWEKLSADDHHFLADGVTWVMENLDCTPEEVHNQWVKSMLAAGWTHGGVVDRIVRTHTNLRPFDQLIEREQLKDHLYLGVVKAMLFPLRQALNTQQEPPSPSDGQGSSHGVADVPDDVGGENAPSRPGPGGRQKE